MNTGNGLDTAKQRLGQCWHRPYCTDASHATKSQPLRDQKGNHQHGPYSIRLFSLSAIVPGDARPDAASRHGALTGCSQESLSSALLEAVPNHAAAAAARKAHV